MQRMPKFCPNDRCRYHRVCRVPEGTFVRYGRHHTAAFGAVQRFRCRSCGRTFSSQTLSIDYYVKRPVDYRRLLRAMGECVGVRACARSLGISANCVTNRTMRAARSALWQHARALEHISLGEDLAADGFESFAVSQYFPNNLHTLAGVDSQYVYAIDGVTIRRKGRMTGSQRRRREQLERRWRADRRGVEKSFARIIEQAVRLHAQSARVRLTLHTDKKSEYLRACAGSAAVVHWRGIGRFAHRRTSSRAARTVDNPLFAVNYIDRQLRKDLHEHTRETVCFARNENLQMERLAIYTAEHNAAKPFRINQPVGNTATHASVAGIEAHTIADIRRRLYRSRKFFTRVELPEWAERIWRRGYPTPLRQTPEYRPGYLLVGIPYPAKRPTGRPVDAPATSAARSERSGYQPGG